MRVAPARRNEWLAASLYIDAGIGLAARLSFCSQALDSWLPFVSTQTSEHASWDWFYLTAERGVTNINAKGSEFGGIGILTWLTISDTWKCKDDAEFHKLAGVVQQLTRGGQWHGLIKHHFGASSLYSFKIITALVHCTLFATTAEGCFRHRSLHSHTLHSLLETLNTTLPSSTSANHKAEKQSLATALGQKIHHISVNVETHVELSRLSWLLSKRTYQTPLLTQTCHWRSPALLLHRPQPKPKTTWHASKGSGGGCRTKSSKLVHNGDTKWKPCSQRSNHSNSAKEQLCKRSRQYGTEIGSGFLVHLSPKLESQSVKILFSTSLLYVLHLYPLPLTSARLALAFAHLAFALAFACISLGPHVPHLCGPSIQIETNSWQLLAVGKNTHQNPSYIRTNLGAYQRLRVPKALQAPNSLWLLVAPYDPGIFCKNGGSSACNFRPFFQL